MILDGKALSAKIKDNIKADVEALKEKTGKIPGLTVIIVGENAASQTYVNMKEKACHYVGFSSQVIRLPREISEQKLLSHIHDLNNDPAVNGILVQLPLPEQINEDTIINTI